MSVPYQSTYPVLLGRLFAHWTHVNEALPFSHPLTIRKNEGRGRAIQIEDIPDFQTAIRTSLILLQETIEDASEARLVLDSAKRAILFRAQAIARNVQWRRQDDERITYPSIRAPLPDFVGSLDVMLRAWTNFDNNGDGTLVLSGRYRRADFQEELRQLKEHGIFASKASAAETALRKKYYPLFDSLPKLFEVYASEVRTRLPSSYTQLIAETPVLPSENVTVSPPVASRGGWLPSTNACLITWEPSEETRPHHYEVRYSPGDHYDPSVESTIGNVPAKGSLMLKTSRFGRRGMPSLFRVYTVLETLEDAGDDPVSIIADSPED